MTDFHLWSDKEYR